ncbi:nucleoside-diphosphate sugar epimerase [Lentzea tibetensis]|uniref:Nucleoside-diphosphate sugar epimerase n=1 Tax=Lentzea tibetensis TaxID=2591470 RepID=A0A563ERV0_9PSEU|nr:NAD(P)H-binding protein [Lentzea tibetensis]TWP50406.1 nucleoside-diphosphate sugar epimerase [Lentzea tibetensis]
MYLVTGAMGHVGREIVVQLVTSGFRIRVLSRVPEGTYFDSEVEVFTGELDDAETLPGALENVEGVFVMASGRRGGVKIPDLLAEAKKAGVRHVVKVSAIGSAFGLTDPISMKDQADEAAVMASGLDWTMLRCGAFMTDLCRWAWSVRMENTVYATAGDLGAALVHPRDVAAAAVVAMTGGGHVGRTHVLTGREELSPRQQVNCLEVALGRSLEFVEETVERSKVRMAASGWCPEYVNALFDFKQQSADCGRIVFETLEQVIDSVPLSLVDWVNENVDDFR